MTKPNISYPQILIFVITFLFLELCTAFLLIANNRGLDYLTGLSILNALSAALVTLILHQELRKQTIVSTGFRSELLMASIASYFTVGIIFLLISLLTVNNWYLLALSFITGAVWGLFVHLGLSRSLRREFQPGRSSGTRRTHIIWAVANFALTLIIPATLDLQNTMTEYEQVYSIFAVTYLSLLSIAYYGQMTFSA